MSFLVFLGGLGDVAGGARIVDIPKETLVSGPGPLLFRRRTAYFRWELGGNMVILGGH